MLGLQFLLVAKDGVHLGHGSEVLPVWAAQPVTMMRASGFSRRARRIAWRAWRTASEVTAQVLIRIALSRASLGGFSLHDLGFIGVQATAEVMTSTAPCRAEVTGGGGLCIGVDRLASCRSQGSTLPRPFPFGRTGHHHLVVGAPVDGQRAAIGARRHRDRHLALGATGARSRDAGGAGSRPAGERPGRRRAPRCASPLMSSR